MDSASFQVTMHKYASGLVAMEYLPRGSPPPDQPRNRILFIGGLGDGLATVLYPRRIHEHLQERGHQSWTVVELLLGCCYSGWKTSTLDRDCTDVAKAVAFFRSLNTSKIVVMGHSTGSQTVAHYCVGPWNSEEIPQSTLDFPVIDGAILQAPVSDREGLAQTQLDIPLTLMTARQMVKDGKADDHMPSAVMGGVYGGALPTARRWLSLASARRDEAGDDYFSSDLDSQRVERIWGKGGFGKRGIPVMVLESGEDPSVPKFVDKEALVRRWADAVQTNGGRWAQAGGVIAGAGHTLNESAAKTVADLCSRVEQFVAGLE